MRSLRSLQCEADVLTELPAWVGLLLRSGHRSMGSDLSLATVDRARVLVVIGTRPEAIKMAPVYAALQRRPEVEVQLVLTGQHSDMVDQVMDRFGLRADHDLGIMRPGQSLYDVAHGCLDGIGDVIRKTRPQAILVQGDTATVAFAALAGFFEKVRVGHVEAGLRSGDKWAPWPEEIFRRLTDVLSDWYFAPTMGSAENLLRENVPAEQVFVTGNTVVDALLSLDDERAVVDSVLAEAIARRRGGQGQLALVTLHRRESFGQPIRDALSGIRDLVEAEPDLRVVYPVHPNPNVHGPAHELLGDHPRIDLLEPVDYFDLMAVVRWADLVLTDSGGIQEEAPSFGTPVLVLREVTERPEGIEAGAAELVGTDRSRIVERGRAVLAGARAGDGIRSTRNPYGDGQAGERIADIVVHALTGAARSTVDWASGLRRPAASGIRGGEG